MAPREQRWIEAGFEDKLPEYDDPLPEPVDYKSALLRLAAATDQVYLEAASASSLQALYAVRDSLASEGILESDLDPEL